MNPKKKLIEVALPLEAINKASAREKSIRHGHPSTLHLWWARRPLAAARAVIFAQMVDDPSAYVDLLRADPKLRRKADSVLKARLKLWEEARTLARKAKGTNLSVPEPGPAPTLLLPSFAATLLRMEMDRVPLWRGDHVAIKQLVEDFARYLYLPRLKDSSILMHAIGDGVALMTWEQDSFGFAESFDEGAGRYRGLRGGQYVALVDADSSGLLVKAATARKQLDAERAEPPAGGSPAGPTPSTPGGDPTGAPIPSAGRTQPKRFHGTVTLDSTRVGRDASRIAEEVIAHLGSLVGADVKVTLEIEAVLPSGAPENVVRNVTENSRTLKFTSQGFETE